MIGGLVAGGRLALLADGPTRTEAGRAKELEEQNNTLHTLITELVIGSTEAGYNRLDSASSYIAGLTLSTTGALREKVADSMRKNPKMASLLFITLEDQNQPSSITYKKKSEIMKEMVQVFKENVTPRTNANETQLYLLAYGFVNALPDLDSADSIPPLTGITTLHDPYSLYVTLETLLSNAATVFDVSTLNGIHDFPEQNQIIRDLLNSAASRMGIERGEGSPQEYGSTVLLALLKRFAGEEAI